MRKIPFMSLMICNNCQLSCATCIHSKMIADDPNYQMTMDEVREFISMLEERDIHLRCLELGGGGEPLLWKNLYEGVALLHASRNIRHIEICTNGYAIDRIIPIIDSFTRIHIASYSPHPRFDKYVALAKAYSNVLIQKAPKVMIKKPKAGEVGLSPCKCFTSSPLYYKQKAYPVCGPPVFNAMEHAATMGYVPTGLELPMDYTDAWEDIPSRELRGTLELCKYCQANCDAPWAKEYYANRLYKGSAYLTYDELVKHNLI